MTPRSCRDFIKQADPDRYRHSNRFFLGVLYFQPMQKILSTAPVAKEIYFPVWFGILFIFGMDYLRKKILTVIFLNFQAKARRLPFGFLHVSYNLEVQEHRRQKLDLHYSNR
ncbi:MAG: hypothetical protein JRI28_06760 [Deltaproteobacteria bacterium]|nr:hypothetical protein [Deltaproteobacteria bacterium]